VAGHQSEIEEKRNRRTHAFAWVPAPMNADKTWILVLIGVHRRLSAVAFHGLCYR
jgi:hypothetical protein